MIGWLWRVLVGRFQQCEHKWKYQNVVKVFDIDVSCKNPAETRIILQCEKCGDIVSRRV